MKIKPLIKSKGIIIQLLFWVILTKWSFKKGSCIHTRLQQTVWKLNGETIKNLSERLQDNIKMWIICMKNLFVCTTTTLLHQFPCV